MNKLEYIFIVHAQIDMQVCFHTDLKYPLGHIQLGNRNPNRTAVDQLTDPLFDSLSLSDPEYESEQSDLEFISTM